MISVWCPKMVTMMTLISRCSLWGSEAAEPHHVFRDRQQIERPALHGHDMWAGQAATVERQRRALEGGGSDLNLQGVPGSCVAEHPS